MKEDRRYRQQEKDMLAKIQFDSGLKDYQIKDIFMFWAYELFGNWQEGSSSVLPYIGKVNFNSTGDVETSKGTQASGEMNIELCDEFLKMIGQFIDDNSGTSDFERKIERRIKTTLADKI